MANNTNLVLQLLITAKDQASGHLGRYQDQGCRDSGIYRRGVQY
jgi:hypothetical protein